MKIGWQRFWVCWFFELSLLGLTGASNGALVNRALTARCASWSNMQLCQSERIKLGCPLPHLFACQCSLRKSLPSGLRQKKIKTNSITLKSCCTRQVASFVLSLHVGTSAVSHTLDSNHHPSFTSKRATTHRSTSPCQTEPVCVCVGVENVCLGFVLLYRYVFSLNRVESYKAINTTSRRTWMTMYVW